MSIVRHVKPHAFDMQATFTNRLSIQDLLEKTAQAPQEAEPFELQDSRPEPMGGWRKSLVAFCITAFHQRLDQSPHWPQVLKREQSYAMAAELERQAWWAGRELGKPNLAMAQLMGRWLNHVESLTTVK